jgi:hypothetical protein
VAEVEVKIAAHDAAAVPSTVDPTSFATPGADLRSVWTTPTTDARLKKRIVRTVIHEVIARYRHRCSRDRSARPLSWRGPHRGTPAQAAARAKRTSTSADVIAANDADPTASFGAHRNEWKLSNAALPVTARSTRR